MKYRMEKETKQMETAGMSRRSFLRLCGQVAAGTALIAVTGKLLWGRSRREGSTGVPADCPGGSAAGGCAGCSRQCPNRK